MSPPNWRPTASLATLRQRADMLAAIRAFFAERGVMEVETPILCRHSVTDPYMPVLSTPSPCHDGQRYFLQTSPEYAMKRLLAAGSGPIYQIARAIRPGEASSRHNPEFSMLEWYRPGISMTALMDEVEVLVNALLGRQQAAQRVSYRQLFLTHLQIDPFDCEPATLQQVARKHVDVQMQSDSIDDWLNLLLAECIEPQLKSLGLVFVYDFPVSQAALARVENDPAGIPVGKRFELYVDGLELANGYDELIDVGEQRRRFGQDQARLQALGVEQRDADDYLLAALEAGLPATSGVALGLDRLVMLALQKQRIEEVLAFPIDRA